MRSQQYSLMIQYTMDKSSSLKLSQECKQAFCCCCCCCCHF